MSEQRFLMNEKEVIQVVENINEYVSKELWMDFDVALSNGWDLTIIGRLDNTLKEANIEITFEQISFVSIPFGWKTDTSSRVIQLATQKEIEELTDKFEVEIGNYIFKFIAEGFNNEKYYFVGAKKISCLLLDKQTGKLE
ncbi:hypothetical protein M5W83_26620 [Paenibacillus thiaminolyticus]|uniref:Uncharacterized protein n=1 Tax=Paenibacillus thiaminolyticus TaxID=49283 RepID=A0AAP9DU93_PANTH|nr:hypothetical protein [Paenibacillus thiaminolyticus]MCY9535538.1 hypothetical protein [Paenibacillus thiaminolyticus]MCY9601689.1 hypothetical protein [Paenibacillus thiaminolyticus]MCY9610726.1 hypothetical protein [Paenibacillus thiaminolyticus]MCY9615861.1 hypothetical protein [Paenibacillus thiaminolyticus]MCY9622136.1 hypothetical protein [Paenibacillus thiaminolyticus]